MRLKLMCAAFASVLALSACETTGGGSAYGAPRTQLSQCTRNALIGAGVSMLTGKKIRWGAFCLTIVFGTWIIILHIPGIAARPGNP